MISVSFLNRTPRDRRSRRVPALMQWCLVASLGLYAAMHAQAAGHTPVTPEQAYQLALEARTVGDYPAMLILLRQAGYAGDLPAQEMLASVLLAGPVLYGDSISSDLCEAIHWSRRATEQGSAVAKHQDMILNGLRDLPQQRDICFARDR